MGSNQEIFEQLEKLESSINRHGQKIESMTEEVRKLQNNYGKDLSEFLLGPKLEDTVLLWHRGQAPMVMQLIPLRDALIDYRRSNELEEQFEVSYRKIDAQLLYTLSIPQVYPILDCSEWFDPSYQEAIEVEKTDNEEEDMKVLDLLYPGYRRQEKIIRPQLVRIARIEGTLVPPLGGGG